MPTVAGRDVELWFDERGRGPAVLWHTGGCGDRTMWERAGYLDAVTGYRHLLFDHRGHGRSGPPATADGYAMAEHVGDVVAALDAAGVERAAFVGYSLGARVGLAVARAHPERLSALVALDSVPPHDSEADDLAAGAARVRAEGSRAVIDAMSGAESESAPDWLLDHLGATSSDAFAGAYLAFATADDFWSAAPALAVPVLFLVGVRAGEEDWEMLARDAARSVPAGEAFVLPGLGHLQAFWRVDASAPPIADFLARRAVT